MDSNILQKKTRTSTLYVLIFFTLLAIILISSAVILRGFGIGGNLTNSQKVAVIYVQGTMVTGDIPTGLGYAASEEISQNIRNAVADKDVKAIVLRIDSPGGSPAAAEEIVDEIRKFSGTSCPCCRLHGRSCS